MKNNVVKLVNLCPHQLDILSNGITVRQLPSEGLARVSCETIHVGEMETQVGIIALTENKYGEVVGLPEPQEGTMFIVSGMVRDAVPERTDLLRVGPLARDENGVVKHTISLSR